MQIVKFAFISGNRQLWEKYIGVLTFNEHNDFETEFFNMCMIYVSANGSLGIDI
jgi:hypothetical protein